MSTASDVSGTLATYTYDPLSRRTNLAYGNGASVAYTYSNAGDLLTLNHNLSGTSNDPHYISLLKTSFKGFSFVTVM